jgi:hypothetical protein
MSPTLVKWHLGELERVPPETIVRESKTWRHYKSGTDHSEIEREAERIKKDKSLPMHVKLVLYTLKSDKSISPIYLAIYVSRKRR